MVLTDTEKIIVDSLHRFCRVLPQILTVLSTPRISPFALQQMIVSTSECHYTIRNVTDWTLLRPDCRYSLVSPFSAWHHMLQLGVSGPDPVAHSFARRLFARHLRIISYTVALSIPPKLTVTYPIKCYHSHGPGVQVARPRTPPLGCHRRQQSTSAS